MKRTREEFIEAIEKALDQNGPYTHNLIGMLLRDCARQHGNEVANGMIEELALEKLGFSKERVSV